MLKNGSSRRRTPARLPGSLSIALAAVLLLAGSPARAEDKSASDERAEALLSNMKAKNYAAAFEMFDPTMKAAVSEEKLKAVWEMQLASLGALRSWTTVQRTQAQGKDVRVALLAFERGELQSRIVVDPQSQLISGFLLQAAPAPASPAPYVDRSKFRAVDMAVGSEPFILGGTLTVPSMLDPVPAVVLVHGSGPQDRDETIGANKVFKDLAEGLASRGIAVLRYDKRTYQYGNKLGDSISVDDEATRDAIAAVGALRARPEVDPKRLFVIGHSMGALLAPEIALRSAPVAGIVLLAPPGRAPWDMVLAQAQYLGTPKKDMADLEAKVSRLKAGTLGSEKLLGAPQSYWKDLASKDGIGTAKKLQRPILILRGSRDYQVTEEDVEAWRRGLAGVPKVEALTIPDLNHLFIAGTGKPGPSEYGTPGHVDAGVIDKVAAFIASAKAE
jgi:alpha-beta hydrolase superfamily lysophospholipase